MVGCNLGYRRFQFSFCYIVRILSWGDYLRRCREKLAAPLVVEYPADRYEYVETS